MQTNVETQQMHARLDRCMTETRVAHEQVQRKDVSEAWGKMDTDVSIYIYIPVFIYKEVMTKLT